jgi:hypothetical protein
MFHGRMMVSGLIGDHSMRDSAKYNCAGSENHYSEDLMGVPVFDQPESTLHVH